MGPRRVLRLVCWGFQSGVPQALSKQLVKAEIAHMQSMEWKHTCHQVERRKHATQQRSRQVQAEVQHARTLKREACLEDAAHRELEREVVLIELEREREERAAGRDAIRASHNAHKGGVDPSGKYRIPPKPRQPYPVNTVASAT